MMVCMMAICLQATIKNKQLNWMRMCFCRDHLPGHSYTYKSPAKREADLSNATFSALEDQIEGLNEIRVT